MTAIDVAALVLHRCIAFGTPLLLGTIGEIVAERSGVLNLGVEGMMAVGAVVAFGVSAGTKSAWLAVLVAGTLVGLMSLLHSIASVNLRANQVVSGLALTTLGLGMSGLLGKPFVGMPPGSTLQPIEIPVLAKIPLLGPMLFDQDGLVYLSILLAIGTWFVMFHTRIGLNLRTVGENPAAADLSGISVYRVRHLCVLFGGILAGIAGAYLSLAYIPSWTEGMTGGRGWIVIGLTIFALWNPIRAIFASYLFSLFFVLAYSLQPLGIHVSLLYMLPYLTTIIVLVLTSRESIRKRIGAPLALTRPYVREEV